jgi:hypothetical protein
MRREKAAPTLSRFAGDKEYIVVDSSGRPASNGTPHSCHTQESGLRAGQRLENKNRVNGKTKQGENDKGPGERSKAPAPSLSRNRL